MNAYTDQHLDHALREQRTSSGRLIAPLRVMAVAVFWVMCLAFGWNLALFSLYLGVAGVTWLLARNSRRAAGLAGFAIAFFDMPVMCVLQRASFSTSTSPGAVAGFTIAIFAVLVAVSLLSLDHRQTSATVLSGTVLGMLLQADAGISLGGMLSTPLVLGLTGVAGGALQQRLVHLTRRLLTDAVHTQRLEQAVHHNERMATMGLLTASVAHEVGNPLTYLLGNIELIKVKHEKDTLDRKELLELLESASVGAHRIARIVRDMKALARKDDSGPVSEVDLKDVVEGSLQIARGEIRRRAQLEVEYNDTPGVVASESRLAQVFLNLLVNAAQAIPEGQQGQLVRVVTGTGKNGEAYVAVTDTGSGISPEDRTRLFTPFFTTKPQGQGTGLGLSICAQLVHNYGGRIEVDSELGKGSTFRVLFPARGLHRSASSPRGNWREGRCHAPVSKVG
ncbi:MAG: hypothetical protein IPJ65_22885 [Archangiaceae bacterium]|nr:hypothetical protein [Archangiaceae bacterium]